MPIRLAMRAASFFAVLCVPLSSTSQIIAVPLESPVSTKTAPSGLSELPRESATRLEGRLFFSAQERQRMDKARKRGIGLGDDGKTVEMPPSVLNGFVKRSDGGAAVWVDGNVRFNAQSRSVNGLLPTDVGGPSEYVKATGVNTTDAPRSNVARSKKVVKPRPTKIVTPRLLPY